MWFLDSPQVTHKTSNVISLIYESNVQKLKKIESEKEFPINCFKCKCFISWQVIRVLLIRMCWAGADRAEGGGILDCAQKYYLFIPCLYPRRLQHLNTKYSNAPTILYSSGSVERSGEKTFFFLSKHECYFSSLMLYKTVELFSSHVCCQTHLSSILFKCWVLN